jgi:hypothetical protein
MSRKAFYVALFALWGCFCLGVTGYLAWQGSRFMGCTVIVTDGKWSASVHSDISCTDARHRAEQLLHDKDYEVR